jgi:hypothetical protein
MKEEKESDGIKVEVAIRVYVELLGQRARANQLQPAMMPNLADTAFQAAEYFVQSLDKSQNG